MTNTLNRPTLPLSINCTSQQVSSFNIRIEILAINTFDPKFSAETYQFKTPMPLARGFEVTSLLDANEKISAIDYDLYNFAITYSISGTNLLDVEAVREEDVNGKSFYYAKFFTKQQITKLEDDQIEFTLTASVSFS